MRSFTFVQQFLLLSRGRVRGESEQRPALPPRRVLRFEESFSPGAAACWVLEGALSIAATTSVGPNTLGKASPGKTGK